MALFIYMYYNYWIDSIVYTIILTALSPNWVFTLVILFGSFFDPLIVMFLQSFCCWHCILMKQKNRNLYFTFSNEYNKSLKAYKVIRTISTLLWFAIYSISFFSHYKDKQFDWPQHIVDMVLAVLNILFYWIKIWVNNPYWIPNNYNHSTYFVEPFSSDINVNFKTSKDVCKELYFVAKWSNKKCYNNNELIKKWNEKDFETLQKLFVNCDEEEQLIK